jgi:hypothetical protein
VCLLCLATILKSHAIKKLNIQDKGGFLEPIGTVVVRFYALFNTGRSKTKYSPSESFHF